VFRTAGIAAELPPDIRLALWEKFILICAFSGITALLRQPVGQILAYQETRDLIQMVMQEGETIARACGIELPADVVMRKYALFKTLDPSAMGSMATDLMAQHRLEVEALNGTIVRLGHGFKIATPCNFVIYAALKPYSNGQPDSLKTESHIHA
jgi:2-dehydropantoate 2-reductase